MSREKVTEDQFHALLNKVLAEQEGWTDDMRFVAVPNGTKGTAMRGYDTTTPYTSHAAYASAVAIVNELYEFDPTASR